MKKSDKLKLVFRLPITALQRVLFKKPRVLSDVETVEYIIQNKCSIARFGDGELDLMCGIGIKFQNADKRLQNRLKQIAKSRSQNCLVCVPDLLNSKKELYKKLVAKDADWWNRYLKLTRGIWYKAFKGKIFGDTNISRFYMEVKDKSRTAEYVKNIKKIWDDANIVFVEGEKSRLGMGNDLFDNAASVKRILCPSSNAFEKYDQIFSEVMNKTAEADLIICALGPTATVLSYDLSQNGRRALDFGHIDVEYEWYKMGVTEKVSISGKDVSESSNELRDAEERLPDNVLAIIK